jgi:hypothetical protein
MTWNEARELIRHNISLDTDINTEQSTFRKIMNINHYCNRYDYNNELGFSVRIGQSTQIEIPWSILHNCFNALSLPKGYNGTFFREHYQTQAEQHPCHVHVVGMIFVVSGIANKINSRSYIGI